MRKVVLDRVLVAGGIVSIAGAVERGNDGVMVHCGAVAPIPTEGLSRAWIDRLMTAQLALIDPEQPGVQELTDLRDPSPPDQPRRERTLAEFNREFREAGHGR